MRVSSILTNGFIFIGAATLSLVAANYAVELIEDTSEFTVRDALDDARMVWAEVEADGLQVTLTGAAPSEADRFAALSAAGTIVDAARLIDAMEVADSVQLSPPRFSTEILRNEAGVSVIGLIPHDTDRDRILAEIQSITGADQVADLIETAQFQAPVGWSDAMSYALNAMERLESAKISVEANYVAITATARSPEERDALERALTRAAPPGLRIAIDIAAPRPVITPFTLRFVIDEMGARFDACSADSDAAVGRIEAAARGAGVTDPLRCTIGLGVPSPNWGRAAAQAIAGLHALGQGTVTFSDADITLIAAEGTDPATFDRVVGDLENELPDVFALFAKLPETVDPDRGPPEFVATLSPEGQVQLRGRITDDNLRRLVESYAQAAFGAANVRVGARLEPDLPDDWPVRVLAALEALSNLSNGAVTATPTLVRITGNTGDQTANTKIASLLAEQLGEAEGFEIDVTYQEQLDPVASQPTPEECEAEIGQILANSKITFEPSSATVDASALGTLDDIADILKGCGPIRLEIQGHTDSQGREIMNEQLSQARAQSVLNELRARRVLTSTFSAKGYGETQPIADNGSEEGREANRRIEFRLIRPRASIPEGDSPLEALAEEAAPEIIGETASDDQAAPENGNEDDVVESPDE